MGVDGLPENHHLTLPVANMKSRNFWIQPPLGFTPATCARSLTQIAAFETRIGFALPPSYRALMAEQNGGDLRYRALPQADFEITQLGGIPDPDDQNALVTLKDYILCSCSQEDIIALQNEVPPFHPERAIVFSDLDGHGLACLDYGYRQATPRQTPSVVFFTDDGNEFLHFAECGPRFNSFDEFLASLQLLERDAGQTFIGIQSALSCDALVQILQRNWTTTFMPRSDDRQGWFNFDAWHEANLPVELDDDTLATYARDAGVTLKDMAAWLDAQGASGRTRRIRCVAHPNQHRAGTYVYPDNPELTLIIEVPKPWFDAAAPMARVCASLRLMEGVESVLIL